MMKSDFETGSDPWVGALSFQKVIFRVTWVGPPRYLTAFAEILLAQAPSRPQPKFGLERPKY
jgi:hypothetical protein